MIVPTAVSLMSIEATGAVVAVTPLMLTVKLSDPSIKASSLSPTVKICVSPALPRKVNVCDAVLKSLVPAVPVVKSTSTVKPPSTALAEMAANVIVPSSATVTSSIVTAVESLSTMARMPVSVVFTSRPFNGVLALTARLISKFSTLASIKRSSVIATVKLLLPDSPADQVTLCVVLAKSLPSPPKSTSMVKS